MIKISTKGRYASRMMLYLAEHFEEGLLHMKDIAQAEEVSEKYLSQLILPLKVAGLIKAGRGAHGGYALSRPPAEIRLLDVLNAVEGPIVLVECVKNAEVCNRSSQCVMRDIWDEFGLNIQTMFQNLSLADVLKRKGAKNSANSL